MPLQLAALFGVGFCASLPVRKDPVMTDSTTSSDEVRSVFVTGLKNAHAMENQALAIMRPQADRLESYPEMAQHLRQHIAETEDQVSRPERILDELGEDRSALKDTALSAMGGFAALANSLAPDEVLKNTFANFAFENYEIAAYESLIALANAGDVSEAVPLLQQNLYEEEAMADWIQQNLETVTLQFAGRKEAGMSAKR
jgi:ferritin-like metal-binding protein YciE